MDKDLIKFYPVDNGDTILIKLRNKKTLLFDCKIRAEEKNPAGYKVCDVKSDLLQLLEKKEKIPFVNIFALTHPDWDHCMGFEDHFHIGSFGYYNEDSKKILIDELWITPVIFSNSLSNDDAKAIRREAKRRKALYDNDSPEKEFSGNRLRIVGYDGGDNLECVPHYYPGNIISEFDGINHTTFSVFIHAPLKSDLIRGQAKKDKNATSIVVQLRFKEAYNDAEFSARVIIGGDADHYIWEKVIEKTEKNNNKEALKWNLFVAPHHCSWKGD